jgi:hypothetical protein
MDKELLTQLLEYFEMDSGYWPHISVYSMGQYYTGVISDELYSILQDIQVAVEEMEDE